MAGGGGEEGGGKLAQFVSNASFATLMLIYTFTELLDLSDQVGKCGWLCGVWGWAGCGWMCVLMYLPFRSYDDLRWMVFSCNTREL